MAQLLYTPASSWEWVLTEHTGEGPSPYTQDDRGSDSLDGEREGGRKGGREGEINEGLLNPVKCERSLLPLHLRQLRPNLIFLLHYE